MRKLAFAAGTVLVAASCSSAPTEPGEVVEAWIDAAWAGNAEAAAALLAGDDIPWIGLGATPSIFVEGAAVYENTNVVSDCRSDHTLGRCETTWNDLWIEAIPEIDEGFIRITAEVVDGKIVAFREWQFSPELVRASRNHVDYLEVYEPERLAAACEVDTAGRACSRLFVDTVHDWVDSR